MNVTNHRGFTMLNVLFSIGLIVTMLAMVLPIYTAHARLQRTATERIQVLWALHGIMEQARVGTVKLEEGVLTPNDFPDTFPEYITSISVTTEPVKSYAKEVVVTAVWTSLQNRALTESLSEIMISSGSRP